MGFSCPICTDKLENQKDFPDGDPTPVPGVRSNCSSTPCGHVFHTYCIRRWMHSGTNPTQCPNCRKQNPRKISLPIYPNDTEGDSYVDLEQEDDSERVRQLTTQIQQITAQLETEKRERNDLTERFERNNHLYNMLSTDFVDVNTKLKYERERCTMLTLKFQTAQSFKTLLDDEVKKLGALQKEMVKYEYIKSMLDTTTADESGHDNQRESECPRDLETHIQVSTMLRKELLQTSDKLATETREKELLRQSLLNAKKNIKKAQNEYNELLSIKEDLQSRLDAATKREAAHKSCNGDLRKDAASRGQKRVGAAGSKSSATLASSSKGSASAAAGVAPKKTRLIAFENLNTTIELDSDTEPDFDIYRPSPMNFSVRTGIPGLSPISGPSRLRRPVEKKARVDEKKTRGDEKNARTADKKSATTDEKKPRQKKQADS